MAWEILFSLDRCGRALCCCLEAILLLQVDHGWGEKGSECTCKGNLEPRYIDGMSFEPINCVSINL